MKRQYSLFVRKRGTRFWHRASPLAMRQPNAAAYWQDILIGLAGAPYEARLRPVTDGSLPEGSFVANEAKAWFTIALEAETAEYNRKKANALSGNS